MSNHFSADNLKFPGDDRRLDRHRPPEASGRLPADHARAEPSPVRPGR